MHELHLLSGKLLDSPRLAVRWMHDRAESMAPQLATATQVDIADWMHDPKERDRALDTISAGGIYIRMFVDAEESNERITYIVSARRTHAALHTESAGRL